MKYASLAALAALTLTACDAGLSSDAVGTPNFDAYSGTTISVSKTAEGFLTKTFPWTIEKAASVDTLHLFRGDAADARFTVTVTRSDSVNVTSVAGQICVTNAGTVPTEGLVIVDKVQYHTGGGEFQDLSGATVTLEPEEQVPAESEMCYDYEIAFEPQSGATYRNVALVTITNLDGSEGTPSGPGEVPADFTVPDSLTGEANRSVTVEDSGGASWTFDDSGSETYDGTFGCDANDGDNVNVVTIVGTGQTAEALVVVHCYALDVSKTAETEYTRTYAWDVAKMSDTTNLILPRGFAWDVPYTVNVDTAGFTDSDVSIDGVITIENNSPLAAAVTGVADVTSPDIAMTVDCDVQFPTTIEAGASLECSYGGTLPDTEERTNTATVTLQNVSTDVDGNVSESGTTDFTGEVTVGFGDPTTEVDVCVAVTDDRYGDLGTVCMADGLPAVLDYTSALGAYAECGTFEDTNTVTVTTSDTEATDESSWTVEVLVPCGPDCTLSQGYWKNHSEFGPAQYDSTWAFLSDGGNTPFFGTGKSWVTHMKEPPKGGNAYIKLARQYMAAWLNGLHGADVSEVADFIEQAMELLDRYDGDPEAFDVDDKDLTHQLNLLQGRLDAFNTGKLGTPACGGGEDS